MSTRVHIDFETTSEIDLRDVGVHTYAEHPSTQVICASWIVVDAASGQHTPDRAVYDPLTGGLDTQAAFRLLDLALDPTVEFHAWNAEFEYTIWKNVLLRSITGLGPLTRKDYPHVERWRCTMARAMYHGLPASLEDAGLAIGLPPSMIKDATGARLMMQMNKPRKKRDGDTLPTWWHKDDPAKLAMLAAYCDQDAIAESGVADLLPPLPLSEQKLWVLNTRMNETGVGVDTDFVKKLIVVAEAERQRLDERMNTLTRGEVPATTNVLQLARWVTKRVQPGATEAISVAAENLPKLERLFHLSGDPVGEEAVRLRREAAKSSVAKLQRTLAVANNTFHRARGLIAYYGASRTGRYAGRLLQPHNYPRGKLSAGEVNLLADAPDILSQIERLKTEKTGTKSELTGALDAVASCLRGTFVPGWPASKDTHFVGGDFSQIEARVIAWLGGQTTILNLFAKGEDVYTHTAKEVGSDNRQLGKVLVLACGFGMGAGKFQDTAKTYGIDLTATEAAKYVSAWRSNNPGIVNFWYRLEDRVRDVVSTAQHGFVAPKHTIGPNNCITIDMTLEGHLTLRLPSGRALWYRSARFDEDVGQLSYEGVNQRTRQWGRETTYGGKLAENITQAIARDIMARALWKCAEENRELTPVMTIHDEIVFSFNGTMIQPGDAMDRVARYMTTVPPWVPGLPIAADVKTSIRYAKG